VSRIHLLAAALVASIVGLGPAVAWDMTTQPPRAAPRSPWPTAAPWKTAGAQMKETAKAMARIYLPPRSAASEEPVPGTSGPVAAAAVTSVITPVPPVIRIPSMPRPTIALRSITVE
jgi:hypothetical protein